MLKESHLFGGLCWRDGGGGPGCGQTGLVDRQAGAGGRDSGASSDQTRLDGSLLTLRPQSQESDAWRALGGKGRSSHWGELSALPSAEGTTLQALRS